MAASPSHRFGQIIGNILEALFHPRLQEYCDSRGLYLDKQGARGQARRGKKVTWSDKYGNNHDLDFVIEYGGSANKLGKPLAFIEAAWRRYTKHSKNKVQEIQAAVLPIAEKHEWDKPFLGAVLAGVFTGNSLDQIKSSGFTVAFISYESIITSFAEIGISADFNEDTPDHHFKHTVDEIEKLSPSQYSRLYNLILEKNHKQIDQFFEELTTVLDRRIVKVRVITLFGDEHTFGCISEAIIFAQDLANPVALEPSGELKFRKWEILVKFCNGDIIDCEFSDPKQVVRFLRYLDS